ncbi:hypothetical protein F5I97DRAFT_1928473 [Phlebopus sp. FC_14]|nr:hypothetical protein F5I97DRAFT_1928473 [Phlebopus sp. FC_14]
MATAAILQRVDELHSLNILPRSLSAGGIAATAKQDSKSLLRDLTNTARDPETTALLQEIESLSGAALVVDKSFYEVTRRLTSITNKQQRGDELSSTCSGLLSRWTKHHQDYKDLLWQSREAAAKARGIVDEFRTHVLPSLCDDTNTVVEKQNIIRRQEKAIENNALESQRQSQAFRDFSEALNTYVFDFSEVVESFDLGEQNEKIRSLNERLRPAKVELDAINREVKRLVLALAGKLVITGIAVWLATMAPQWWATVIADGPQVAGTDPFGVRSSGALLLQTVMERQAVANIYNSIKLEQDKEQAKLNQMSQLEATLDNSRPVVEEMCAKLGVLVSVWSFMTADLREIQHALSYTTNNATMSPDFVHRIERLKKLYGYLSQALRHYQVVTHL